MHLGSLRDRLAPDTLNASFLIIHLQHSSLDFTSSVPPASSLAAHTTIPLLLMKYNEKKGVWDAKWHGDT